VAAAQTAESLLFGISLYDPSRLGGAAIALAAATAIGSLLPARRASRLDPMTALRDE
jgi:ABC-type antimicrobial peptide transport system permease subunit